jgi:hypothetical protein
MNSHLSSHIIEHKKKPMTNEVGNPCPNIARFTPLECYIYIMINVE